MEINTQIIKSRHKRKPRKKHKKRFWILLSIGAVLLCCIAYGVIKFIIVYKTPLPASDLAPMSMESSVSIETSSLASLSQGSQSALSMYEKDPLLLLNMATDWYPTWQDSAAVYEQQEKTTHLTNPLFVLDNEKFNNTYFFGTTKQNGGGEPSLFCYIFWKKDGKFSNVANEACYAINPGYGFRFFGTYVFTPEETAASCLMDQFLQNDSYFLANNGTPIYAGISTSPNVRNLRMLGKPPTRIIKFGVKGKTYYAWFYEGTDFYRYLSKDPNFNFNSFTYDQIVKELNIHFASPADPLSKEVTITTAPQSVGRKN